MEIAKTIVNLKYYYFSFSLFPIRMLWGVFWTLAEILSVTLHKC